VEQSPGSSEAIEQDLEKNSRTPNTEQRTTNNDNIGATTTHLDDDNRPTEHLDIDFHPDFEQASNGSNRIEHQTNF